MATPAWIPDRLSCTWPRAPVVVVVGGGGGGLDICTSFAHFYFNPSILSPNLTAPIAA